MLNVTCALIIKDGKILITQNGPGSDHAFQWEFPGGKTHSGESEENCIVREIREELELDIKILAPLQAIEYDYGIKKIRLVPFICRIKGGKLKLNNHVKGMWILPEEFQSVHFSEADKVLISLKENREILEEYTRE